MAKVINSRIYLECEIGSPDSYMKELNDALKLFPDIHITIWDQSGQEEKFTNNDLFDMYILMNKIGDGGTKVFNRGIWANLVAANLSRTNYLQIGCWKSESSLIHEIKSVCRIRNIKEYGEQTQFFVELNESAREYICNSYLDSKGNIKWFNLGLYYSSEKDSLIFSSNHFGEEIYILKLSSEEVEKTIITVEKNNVFIRINRHQ